MSTESIGYATDVGWAPGTVVLFDVLDSDENLTLNDRVVTVSDTTVRRAEPREIGEGVVVRVVPRENGTPGQVHVRMGTALDVTVVGSLDMRDVPVITSMYDQLGATLPDPGRSRQPLRPIVGANPATDWASITGVPRVQNIPELRSREAAPGTMVFDISLNRMLVFNGRAWLPVEAGDALIEGLATRVSAQLAAERDEENALRDAWEESPWSDFFEAWRNEPLPLKTIRRLLDDPESTQTFVELAREYAQRIATSAHFARTKKVRSMAPLDGIVVKPPYETSEDGNYHCGESSGLGSLARNVVGKDGTLLGQSVLVSDSVLYTSGIGKLRLIPVAINGKKTPLVELANQALSLLSQRWASGPYAQLKDPNEPLLAMIQHPPAPSDVLIHSGDVRVGRYLLTVTFSP